MDLAIRTAPLPADAPRWTDRNDSTWVEIDGDRLVLVEHAGQPVPVADAIPRVTVDRQHGPLTAEAAAVSDQDEVADDVVQDVADAIGAYRQHLTTALAEEIARLRLSSAEHAIRANRAEESEQRRITERDGHRMEADRLAGEMYRVRDALGVGPGGADLGLQVRDALAGRDAEIEKHRVELGRLRKALDDLTCLKPGDDDYCEGDLSFDGHHTSDFRKRGFDCVWCGAVADDEPATVAEEKAALPNA